MKDKRGVTVILIALLIAIFIGVAAFAIDIGHRHVASNELQNAADAGALAGAQFLYKNDGTVNSDANQKAYDTATVNKSEHKVVEVEWPGGNVGDVQRGHWSFSTNTFTPNDSLLPVDLWDKSTLELDQNTDFINAVRVKTRREKSPVTNFFATIFGSSFSSFSLSREAVAYIGFAGTLNQFEVKQPIAICWEALHIDPHTNNEKYSCSIGRMINIGSEVAGQETGGWTDFKKDSLCLGNPDLSGLVCAGGNRFEITLGEPVATNGGDIEAAFSELIQCWENNTGEKKSWRLTLPVIECPGNKIEKCQKVVGAVTINIVWITITGAVEDPLYNNAPTSMKAIPGMEKTYPNWDPGNTNGKARWDSFVSHFHLQNVDGNPAPYENKSIYFLPDCNPHQPIGRTGGGNSGILAKIPVLVK